MIFRQLFHHESHTYTYLIADEETNCAGLIDPVLDNLAHYLQLVNELGLTLKVALDTHVHADHVTALGALRENTGCTTMIGSLGDVGCSSESLEHGKEITLGRLKLNAIFTPGHTDDSYCFYLAEKGQHTLLSGDTLLIRGTGRTDFQNGDPQQLFESIHQHLLTLPKSTLVYPAHDYKGWTRSTIAEESAHNPRLQLSLPDFIEHMQNLDLPDPKMMDVAVPANLSCGHLEV